MKRPHSVLQVILLLVLLLLAPKAGVQAQPATHSEPVNSLLKTGETSAWLGQNRPQPAAGSTIISYYVPETAEAASIYVVGSGGGTGDHWPILIGAGEINFPAKSMANGVYF